MRAGTDGARCGLIVGLGNPGSDYEGTRHNAGFDVLDRLLSRAPGRFECSRACSSKIWCGRYAGRSLFLQKPETFMNLSGEAVAPLARAEGIPPEEIMVVYDDMDLPLGRLRMRPDGGSGGHNGVASIIESLGTESFPRLRIGIGRDTDRAGRDYVLSRFEGHEKELYAKTLEAAADAVVLALRRGLSMAMNSCNSMDLAGEKTVNDESLIPKQ